ncbi:MAG: DUF853 family protein [Eggerthellaceae bacterium]|nr:DUF853 family protein [Eggerthellaceae bacterium]
MYVDDKLLIAVGEENVHLLPRMANRHGLIAGATGTGKTVTVKTIIQSMSDAGIPTFVADVKGDVSGIAVPGEGTEKLLARLEKLGITDYDFHGCPVRFWDVYGEAGIPVRTTITEMGPVLLARLLGLTEVQKGVLNIAFHVADDEGLLLLDLKDLRSMISYLGENAADYMMDYGSISKQSVGAIQRALLQLEDAGGDVFFGEPALDISDWLTCDTGGCGYVNILDCVKLVQSPLLYSTFLLWMLSELYEMLPEVGDVDKPKACFFFDEAHLLFDDAPKALMDKIEQVVKLIRSKGVGVYFITQNPADVPNAVLAQLGNRVQHALRAYTPAEQKAIRAAAESFRENPAFKTVDVLTELGTGEALISFLDEDGRPSIVQRAMVIAPACSMDAAPEDDKAYIVDNELMRYKYQDTVDRESAYELLNEKAIAAIAAAEEAAAAAEAEKLRIAEEKEAEKARIAAEKERERQMRQLEREAEAAERARQKELERQRIAAEREAARQKREREKLFNRVAGAALTSASRNASSSLARGILGALKKSL